MGAGIHGCRTAVGGGKRRAKPSVHGGASAIPVIKGTTDEVG